MNIRTIRLMALWFVLLLSALGCIDLVFVQATQMEGEVVMLVTRDKPLVQSKVDDCKMMLEEAASLRERTLFVLLTCTCVTGAVLVMERKIFR